MAEKVVIGNAELWHGDALAIGVIFTGISLGRSYILRRAFNRR